MPGSKVKKDSDKIKRELAAMKEAMALNKLVMNEDLEGVFISNPARESETISDEVADRILKNIEKSGRKREAEGLSIINRFAYGGEDADSTANRKRPARSAARRSRYTKSRSKAKRTLKVKVKKARR